ncbi:MAG: DNA repair protein RecO [Chloroflexi bacterium]|nr:DNA repair protein RecO [Chloroflexota bacterium]
MAVPRLYKTEAVIIRQRKFGEADRILTLLTPAFGKIEAKARGVRKTTSRMSGHLQPLNRCMIQLARGRMTDVIAGCETLESFHRLREDLDRLSESLYVAELVERMLPERVPNYPSYRLLLDTLRRLEQGDGREIALRYFEIRLLDQGGFRPELEQCVGCGKQIEAESHFFAPRAGGVTCPACAPDSGGARSLTLNGLKVLRQLQREPYNKNARLRLDAPLAQELERHLRSYVVCVLERDVNSAAFIDRLRRESQLTPAEV